MITIGICDANQKQRRNEIRLLEEYASEARQKIRIFSCGTGIELLQHVKAEGACDIYLMDLVMPMMSGSALAGLLKENGDPGKLILLTDAPDRACEAFVPQPFRYLLKPIRRAVLYETLDRAIAELTEERGGILEIRTQEGSHEVAVNEIHYIEHIDRRLRYHLRGSRTVDSRMLRSSVRKALEPLLSREDFMMVGASLAVNLHEVRNLGNGCLEMMDGAVIYPPERAIRQVRDAWRDLRVPEKL